jgi:hypothetical protein
MQYTLEPINIGHCDREYSQGEGDLISAILLYYILNLKIGFRPTKQYNFY